MSLIGASIKPESRSTWSSMHSNHELEVMIFSCMSQSHVDAARLDQAKPQANYMHVAFEEEPRQE